jgi:hypothetical protein
MLSIVHLCLLPSNLFPSMPPIACPHDSPGPDCDSVTVLHYVTLQPRPKSGGLPAINSTAICLACSQLRRLCQHSKDTCNVSLINLPNVQYRSASQNWLPQPETTGQQCISTFHTPLELQDSKLVATQHQLLQYELSQ